MRVLMLSKALVVGAYQHKPELIASSPDIDLTCVVPPRWGKQHAEIVYSTGYRLVVEPIRFADNYHFFYFPGLPSLLREIRPDLVHVDEEPYNLATFLATRQSRSVGAHVLFFTWQNIRRRYPPPFSLMERWAYRASSHAIAGNHEAAGVLRSKGYRGPVSVIPQFGVDETLFSPRHGEPRPAPFTIGYAGRLIEPKGLTVLFDAVAGLRGEWALRVIGDGPMRAILGQRAAKLGATDRITFSGSVSSLQMPAHLRELDVLVVPSLTTPGWKEQFGRVLVEAMACGVPVIGSDSGEIPNVIGDAGIVVPEGDVLALREQLQRLRESPALRADLGARGRARVLERYTHQRIVDQTVAVYRSLARPSQSPRASDLA